MPKTCPQCQSEAPDDANNCTNCGASLAAGPAAAQAAPAMGAPAAACRRAARSTRSVPAFKFEAARWSRADRIAGIATIVLFISLFLPWYTVSLGFVSGSVNGLWHGWMYITLILSIVIVAYLVLRAGWDRLPIDQEIPHVTAMMIATIVNLVLVVIAFIDKPGGGGVGWGFGAIPRAHRGDRRGGAVRHPAAARQDDVARRRATIPPPPTRRRRYRRTAASRSPGILAADGSASKATNRRMTS